MSLQIRLLGIPAIIDSDGVAKTIRGHQSWALLTRILLSKRPLSRREIASELFPDTGDPLGSVRWCLASLRRAIGSASSLSGDPVIPNLPPAAVVDIFNLELGTLDTELAGNLLEGVEPRCSPEFSTWLLVERERIGSMIDAQIRRDTLTALAMGQYAQATALSELAVHRVPFDEGSHILLVKSLSMSGKTEAALHHIAATETSFRDELGVELSAALRSAARQTISAPPAGISPSVIVRILIESGQAALAAGAVDAGIDCLRRAAADAERENDRQLYAEVLLELGTALVHAVRGHDDEGAILLSQAVDLARHCSDEKVVAASLRELGYVDALAGRRPAAAKYLAEAVVASDDADSLAGIYGVTGFNLVDWGKVEEGLENYNLSIDYARSSNNRRREAWSLGIGGWGQLQAGRPDIAIEWLTDCLSVVNDLRWVSFRPWPQTVMAEARLKLGGDPATLRGDVEEAFAFSCQVSDPCWEAAAARVLGLTFAAERNFARSMDWLSQARQRCVRNTDAYKGLLVVILATQVEVALDAGQPEIADSTARELLSLSARTHMDGYAQTAMKMLSAR